MEDTTEICYCLEMFRKTDPNAQGECLKMKCGRYKLEQRRKAGDSGKPRSIKEMSRRKKVNESRSDEINNHDRSE